MINRIEKEINNIIRWQQRFENLVKKGLCSAKVLDGRAIKAEQLKLYDQLLARHPPKRLNPEERIFRKDVVTQRRDLERELYPLGVIRLLRNMFRLGTAIGKRLFGMINPTGMSARQSAKLSNVLTKTGFGELKPDLTKKQPQSLLTKTLSESIAPGQRVDYEVFLPGHGRKSLPEMDGFQATLHSDRGEPLSIKVEAASGITKAQSVQLLQGRSVNTRQDVWTVPDLNDRDAEGNIRIREIKIPDFNPRRELEKLPVKFDSETEKRDILNELQDGKRVLSKWKINGEVKTIGLELNPVRRGFALFQGNKKTSLDKLYGKAPWEGQKLGKKAGQTKSNGKARVVKMR